MAKEINVRIGNKYDTAENWTKASFIPLKGEFIIYAPDNDFPYERIKIGDGVTPIGALSFVNEHIEETLYGGGYPKVYTFKDFWEADRETLSSAGEWAENSCDSGGFLYGKFYMQHSSDPD